jgi:nanoRNase/pAp phosphatase (c-di-AMP/oligoRNAs hydrolase)
MDQNDKQAAVEQLKGASNVLVTVSTNPTVDDLSAAIGFSLLLGRLNKHATAVFSGAVPPAISFLEPEKQLDNDVGSLRDFIIALDKDKADKLRYKVEDNVVKIFITPYKTRISQDDLSFSEGDFNVDAVVALGVSKREDLDNAIKSHGRILHDATVITINTGGKTSSLGSVNWQDTAASSLCEMLVSISESFGSGLLDQQIATAFLTGIVAETERFSNTKTTPKVMTMSAQLMAAGANQQLIATNLEVESPPSQKAKPPPEQSPDNANAISIDHNGNISQPRPESVVDQPPADKAPPQEATLPKPQPQPKPEPQLSPAPTTQPVPEPVAQPEPPASSPPSGSSLKELEDEIAAMAGGVSDSAPPAPAQSAAGPGGHGYISPAKGHGPLDISKQNPAMGGTFNATSEQAHEDAVSDMQRDANATILSHGGQRLADQPGPPADQPTGKAADVAPLTLPSAAETPPPPVQSADQAQPPPLIQPPAIAPSPTPVTPAPPPAEPSQPPPVPPEPSGEDSSVDDARKAVEEALGSPPFEPGNNPVEGLNAQPLGDVVHDEPPPKPDGNTFKFPSQQ